jgi:putative redox protein
LRTVITTRSQIDAFQTTFSASGHSALADAPTAKGGGGAGFGPHELLEAALATCLNMAVRMQASKLGIPISEVTTIVNLDRSDPVEAAFNYRVTIAGDISPDDRLILDVAARTCPVLSTLAKRLVFGALP